MKKILLISLATFGAQFSALAVLITPTTVPQWTGDTNSNLSPAEITTIVGGSALALAYTQNVGGSEEGPFASSFTTTFSNSPGDPADALIDYVGGATIPGSVFLYVKDGNQSPAFYIFDITSWNRTDDLQLQGFWPDQGAISHVSLLNRASVSVPEGGATVAIFGLALTCVGLVRRYRKA